MSIYRHTLTRYLTDVTPQRWLGVVAVNPSTAESELVSDGKSNDNTVRSLLRIAAHNGFDAVLLANLSPFRATDPTRLIQAMEDGDDVFDYHENDRVLVELARHCEVVACAWGSIPMKHPALQRRASAVRELLLDHKPVLHCFGKTKGGWPKHPLFLPRATPLTVFATRDESLRKSPSAGR